MSIVEEKTEHKHEWMYEVIDMVFWHLIIRTCECGADQRLTTRKEFKDYVE